MGPRPRAGCEPFPAAVWADSQDRLRFGWSTGRTCRSEGATARPEVIHMPFHPDGPGFAGDHTWWASGGWHIVPLLMFLLFIGVVVWAVLRLTSSRVSTV